MQVFRQADKPGRTFVTYTSDTYGDGTSTCYQEAAALGFDVRKSDGTGRTARSSPRSRTRAAPTTISFVEFPQGSHNMTVHPSGEWLYNSNSDLITSTAAGDRVHRHLRPGAPGRDEGARAADAARPRDRVARHHVQRGRLARLLGRALAGRDHRHDRPGRARADHLVPEPGDQRLAPGRPVHADRRERPRARVPRRRGRVRGRRRHRPVPERRRLVLRGHRRARARTRRSSATTTSTTRGPTTDARRHLHGARLRRARARAGAHDRLVQRRHARARRLRPRRASRSAGRRSRARA